MYNNSITLAGVICSKIDFSHNFLNETFYIFNLKIKRKNETFDIIPIVANKKLTSGLYINKFITVNGEFHSFNSYISNKHHLKLFCFAKSITINSNENEYCNIAKLNGYICRDTIYRQLDTIKTCDTIVACNRKYRKSDYIPICSIANNAKALSEYKIGDLISIYGQVHSREYEKNNEKHSAYEIFITSLRKVADTN